METVLTMERWQDKAEFKERIFYFSRELGIDIKLLSLRPMKNKWASCSTNGNLNFNTELLELDKEIGDYVIVHELLHFRVPNHGKLWKSLMMTYLGDYEKTERKLKTLQGKFDFRQCNKP